MRIIEMRPELTPFDVGQRKRASSWRFVDVIDVDDMGLDYLCRKVWHYDVLMMEFHGFNIVVDHHRNDTETRWTARPLSIGIGSATDQQGINQLCGARFYRNNSGDSTNLKSFHYQMRRDVKGGGPRIVYTGHPSGEHVLPL